MSEGLKHTLTGTVELIMPVQEFKGGFTKREFVLAIADREYTQYRKFSTLKDRTAALDNVNVGDVVSVKYDMRGRMHNGKCYNEEVAWSVHVEQAAPPEMQPDEPPADLDDGGVADSDGLPF